MQQFSLWLVTNYVYLTAVGITVGYTVVVVFLTWLICRISWGRDLEKRLSEITRGKLKDRDDKIFLSNREIVILKEQVEVLSVNSRAALNFVHHAAEVLHAPAREIRIHKEKKG